MPSERVTHTEYIVRISVPKTTHEDFILRSGEFSKPVHDEIRRAISVARHWGDPRNPGKAIHVGVVDSASTLDPVV